jgi:Protein of unknown function (DUF3192)
MRLLSAVMVALVLFACSSGTSRRDAGLEGHLTLAELAASNQSKLAQLSVGMSKDDAISIMGAQTSKTPDGVVNNPWTVETFVGKDGAQYEALYYVTRRNQPFTPVRKSLTTAVVIRDGQVIGWGEDMLQRYK